MDVGETGEDLVGSAARVDGAGHLGHLVAHALVCGFSHVDGFAWRHGKAVDSGHELGEISFATGGIGVGLGVERSGESVEGIGSLAGRFGPIVREFFVELDVAAQETGHGRCFLLGALDPALRGRHAIKAFSGAAEESSDAVEPRNQCGVADRLGLRQEQRNDREGCLA